VLINERVVLGAETLWRTRNRRRRFGHQSNPSIGAATIVTR